MHRKFGDQWYEKVDYGSRKQLERQLPKNYRKNEPEPWKHANLGFWQGVINDNWSLFQPFVGPVVQTTKWSGRSSAWLEALVGTRNYVAHPTFKPPVKESALEDLKEILRIIQTAAASFENTHG